MRKSKFDKGLKNTDIRFKLIASILKSIKNICINGFYIISLIKAIIFIFFYFFNFIQNKFFIRISAGVKSFKNLPVSPKSFI